MNAQEGFSILSSLGHDALEKHQLLGAELFGKSDFEGAQAVAEQAQKINALILDLEKMRAQWKILIPEPDGITDQTPEDPNTLAGVFTPNRSFRLPILKALVEMGGKGETRKVIDKVGEVMKGILNDADYQMIRTRREMHWRNTCSWERNTMKDEGLLRNDSEIGIWEISSEGRSFFQSQSNN